MTSGCKFSTFSLLSILVSCKHRDILFSVREKSEWTHNTFLKTHKGLSWKNAQSAQWEKTGGSFGRARFYSKAGCGSDFQANEAPCSTARSLRLEALMAMLDDDRAWRRRTERTSCDPVTARALHSPETRPAREIQPPLSSRSSHGAGGYWVCSVPQ